MLFKKCFVCVCDVRIKQSFRVMKTSGVRIALVSSFCINNKSPLSVLYKSIFKGGEGEGIIITGGQGEGQFFCPSESSLCCADVFSHVHTLKIL